MDTTKKGNSITRKEYIEREAAQKVICDYCCFEQLCDKNADCDAADALKAIPAADVRPVVTESPYMQAAIDSVIDERKRQINIWGCQYDASMFEFMSILGEEYGELCEAVNETCFKNPKHPERGGLDNVYKEASHVAAVAVKLMEALLSGGADMRQKEVDKCND